MTRWRLRNRLQRMTDAELDRYLKNHEDRDRLVLQFGVMVYAAAVTQAVYEQNWMAIVWGVASLFATWIGWRLLTR